MDQIQPVVFLVAVIGYTVAATIWDQKFYKIPNKLTLPMFFAGWIYQGVFDQFAGLATGGLGFLVGFGVLFLLWMIGTAGGGDVKLFGALSVWMGFKWSLYILIVSTFIVVLVTICIVIGNVLMIGPKRMKKKMLATGKPTKAGEKRKVETVEEKQQRRIMAYALPIALATWGLLAMAYTVNWPPLPWTLI
ncbi:A24 family peptidase [uncultured Rubinisphaera sp.]|uniref:A24 family peptidase n=1 Tax=uncultured Rubinisphaera sp. TaxID=1678686 RepID=UPI0030D8D350